MLVEDDLAIAQMYQLGLDAAGFDVAVFADASAMFQALDLDVPDAAVLDWQLPGLLTGVDIIENLRLDLRAHTLPIIMLSNHLGDADGAAERAFKAGAQEWLIKSATTPAQLAQRLKAAISQPASDAV
ncbi:MAG: response regulator transcription factor [Candidatus Dormibacteraceae bacterium]